MAKMSSIQNNNRRRRLVAQKADKRKRLKEIANDLKLAAEERFAARIKLAEMPRNSSATRIRNRCEVTGRARGYYRKLRMCRNQLRELASQGLIPGMVKSSW
ncbi:MAG: 30S ribosomal protein S14 [Hyphomicrobium sp.]